MEKDSELPFHSLLAVEIRQVYDHRYSLGSPIALTEPESDPRNRSGNYIARAIAANLRVAARKTLGKCRTFFEHMLFELPVELVLEIFEHLHPLDLYHLCQTAKPIRSLLLDPRNSKLWKKSYAENLDLPYCPEDVSYPKWTSLLFGPDTCDICGSEGSITDFSFRKRFCTTCMDRSYLKEEDFPGGNANVYHLLISTLPYSRRRSGINVRLAAGEKRYLRSDVYQVEYKIRPLVNEIVTNFTQSGFEASVKIWELAEKQTVNRTAFMHHVNICNEWLVVEHDQIIQRRKREFDKLKKRFIGCLTGKGIDPQDMDIQTFCDSLLHSGLRKLRGPVYRQALHDALQILRRKVISDLYMQLACTVNPDLWSGLPAKEKLLDLQKACDFIRSRTEEVGVPPTADFIRGFLSKYHEYAEHHLLSELLSSQIAPEVGNTKPGLLIYEIELATSIFFCPVCESDSADPLRQRAFIGRNEIGPHLECGADGPLVPREGSSGAVFTINASSSGILAARSLLDLLDLDADTTTAHALNNLDHRFLCNKCPIREPKGGVKGRYAFTWRECVSHQISMRHDVDHSLPSWTLLTTEAADCVRFCEQIVPAIKVYNLRTDIWGCRRCLIHLHNPIELYWVKEHVKNVHEHRRYKPILDVDYFIVQSKSNAIRKPYSLGLQPEIMYKCMHCPTTKNRRLRSLRGLIPHLIYKHKLPNPDEGDWSYVRVAERTTEDLESTDR